jgi:hypothetical protein
MQSPSAFNTTKTLEAAACRATFVNDSWRMRKRAVDFS